MRRRAGKSLTDEDRILWGRVVETIKPLPGRPAESEIDPPPEPTARPLNLSPASMPADAGRRDGTPEAGWRHRQAAAPVGKARLNPLERPMQRKIARGRIALDASIDLHGLSQAEAHDLLLAFLGRAQAAGLRHVLVITGKGSAPDRAGVLRQAVPAWLAKPAFAERVSGFAAAGRGHGGEGALYVRLKRLRAGR